MSLDSQQECIKNNLYKVAIHLQSKASPGAWMTPILFDGVCFERAMAGERDAEDALKDMLFYSLKRLEFKAQGKIKGDEK